MEETLLKRARNLIAGRIGLLVREGDDTLLRQVIAERSRALNLPGAEQYCRFLDSDADLRREREELAILLTTGETYFFRDSGQHTLLQNRILPQLLERSTDERMLRIWCAACASGEEAYSIAILLDELMPGRPRWNISILGTDINHSAIERARSGIYSEWSFRGMSESRRQRYFHHHKNAWVLDDAIRGRVTFQPCDLVADEFPDYASGLYDMDLILCRNTFIYMAPEVISRIADKFAETLVDGGILISGHGELYAHRLGKLRTAVFPESIIYRKAAAPFFPPATPLPEMPHPAREKRAVFSAPQQTRTSAPPPATTGATKETAVPAMQQAWQYANQGRHDKAAESCNEMIAGNPLDAGPHYLLALLAQERGDFTAAKKLLKKVIYLAPSFIAAYLDLGDLYTRGGDDARARKMRSTARDLLRALPGSEQVRYYGASTVNTVLQYVEHLLSIH